MAVTVKINGKKVTFDLSVDSEGEVQLDITQVEGQTSDNSHKGIIWIDVDGQLNRGCGVDPDIGLSLNIDGEIKKGEYF
jgi:hypothetical protein